MSLGLVMCCFIIRFNCPSRFFNKIKNVIFHPPQVAVCLHPAKENKKNGFLPSSSSKRKRPK